MTCLHQQQQRAFQKEADAYPLQSGTRQQPQALCVHLAAEVRASPYQVYHNQAMLTTAKGFLPLMLALRHGYQSWLRGMPAGCLTTLYRLL